MKKLFLEKWRWRREPDKLLPFSDVRVKSPQGRIPKSFTRQHALMVL
jgi:hypothetical protein